MLRRRCYQKLDEPLLVWMGLEWPEIVVTFTVGIFVAVVAAILLGLGLWGMLAGLAGGIGMTHLFRRLRKGGPGYVFSRIYRLGLLEWLPPAFRPRHLLPVSAGRFRLSPVPARGDPRERRFVRKYFGR